ncbi:MAG: AMP-binding protein [Bacilli bacterium]|nr:AMP-binding protein [Bacilli bacterium]
MELSLYDLLKERATCCETKNNVVYIKNLFDFEYFTYNDLYKIVNQYINLFSKLELKNKRKFVLVDNSIDSIAIFLALLECKAIPILISKNNIYSNKENIDNKNLVNEYLTRFNYDYILSNTPFYKDEHSEEYIGLVKYAQSIPNIHQVFENEHDDDSKFIICTSGSTSGKSKLVLIKEKDLLNKNLNNFLDTVGDTFYTYISIASISGIVFNILIPLLLKNKVVLDYLFDFREISKAEVNNLLLPRNILDLLNDERNDSLDLSNIKNFYLSGEINNLETIKSIREKFPSLKRNVFVNLYGSTETMGVISTCEEINLKNSYINQIALSKGEIIYTYDKINVYKMIKENNTWVSKKINVLYDDYTFFACLPVSSNVVNGVEVKDNFGEIIVDSIKTGDIGTYIDNKLYVICRTNEVATINGINYYLTAIENLFSRLTGLKVAALKIPNQDKIFVAINYDLDCLSGTNFKNIIPIITKCYELCEKLSFIPLEKPMIIESEKIPKSLAMRKIIKREIIPFIEKQQIFDYYITNYEKVFLDIVNFIFESTTGKKTNIIRVNNLFKIEKGDNITFSDIVLMLKYCHFIKYNEDEKYFYLEIDDRILFDSYLMNGKNFKKLVYNKHYFKSIIEKYEQDNFIEIFNKQLSRVKTNDINYISLHLTGKTQITKDSVIFYPIQISSYENILFESSLEIPKKYSHMSTDMVLVDCAYNFYYHRIYNCKCAEDNKYYSESHLKKKIEYFKRYLNHEYFIDNYGNCYLDGNLIDKKECFIFDKISVLGMKLSALKEGLRIHKLNSEIEGKMLGEHDTIVVLNDKFSHKEKWCRLDCDKDFSLVGLADKKCIHGNADYQLESIINSLYVRSDGIPILFVSGLRGYTLKKNDSNSLIDLVNQEKLNSFLNLIELVKKQPKRCVKIDDEEIEIDFSKLKIVYMLVDENLYSEPTKEKYLELGYPKQILNSVDKIQSFFGLFQEYKTSKVKKKVK